MKKSVYILPMLGVLLACNAKKSTPEKSSVSQYAIENNTMILYDNKIPDAIKSRKFYHCLDLFSSDVYARFTERISGSIINYRIISFFYDERTLLGRDLRESTEPTAFYPVDFYLLGYSLENGLGTGMLHIIKSSKKDGKFDFFVKNVKTDFTTLANMANDSRNVMADQIVQKKDGEGSTPFRRMNVFSSNIYVKHPQNNSFLKVVDIYRPAEVAYEFKTDQVTSNCKWFATAMAIDKDLNVSNGNLYYILNPNIIDKE